ncbi:hypothetical protein RYX45_01425 [Alkalihalophilus pseudofirmus]|uniref:DUF4760 domain-containing protein n=1 Tax=Alkalihalophilus pseudofirmus TaxID=79885 RepID=A0AAJ2KTZ4_ALKPS|nr:hypothetical protein [Alkalihalophilus pseudofirmus]MDV2883823.1 hypothetical protein [Alkalihalophilus pseudofirmus]
MGISEAIQLLGIIVTGIFSYLVWRATAKTAEIAQSNFEIQKLIQKQRDEELENVKFMYRATARTNMYQIIKALSDQRTNLNINVIQQAKSNHEFSEFEMAKYFDENERIMMVAFYSLYNQYLNKWWKDSTGDWLKSTKGEDVQRKKESSIDLAEELNTLAKQIVLERRYK